MVAERGREVGRGVEGPLKVSGLDPGNDMEVGKVLEGELHFIKVTRTQRRVEWSKTREARRRGSRQQGGSCNRPGMHRRQYDQGSGSSRGRERKDTCERF